MKRLRILQAVPLTQTRISNSQALAAWEAYSKDFGEEWLNPSTHDLEDIADILDRYGWVQENQTPKQEHEFTDA